MLQGPAGPKGQKGETAGLEKVRMKIHEFSAKQLFINNFYNYCRSESGLTIWSSILVFR